MRFTTKPELEKAQTVAKDKKPAKAAPKKKAPAKAKPKATNKED